MAKLPETRSCHQKQNSVSKDDSGRLNSVEIETNDDLEAVILKYYPAFDKHMIHKAISIWSTLPPYADVKFP